MKPEYFGALVFWGLAAMTVVPAVMILVVRDVIRCAMLLLTTLSGVAGLFVLLGADFLGFVQVIVYIGGILILLMFGVMLTDRDPVLLKRSRERGLVAPGLIAGFFVLMALCYVVMSVKWRGDNEQPPINSSERIGELLMTDFILPFEIISVLLLAALLGAAFIARIGGADEPAD